MVGRRPVRHSLPSLPDTQSAGRVQVPKLVQDPIASLRPAPILISMLSQDYEVPSLVAADWLTILMREDVDLEEIFPGLVPGAADDVDDALINGSLSFEDLYETCLEILAMASGRKWYVTLRLIGVAKQNWDVIGAELALKGVDANRLALAAWLDAFVIVLIRNMDQTKVNMFLMKLEAPPANVDEPEPEIEADAFMSMA